MYKTFTDRARKVMQLANQEAQRFNHDYVGTEHILLGLVKEGAGGAADVLKNLDIDLRRIRLEVEKIIAFGPGNLVTPGKLPQTPRAKKVIEHSIEEARNLNHNYVGIEHLFLGLLREKEGVAAQVLLNLDFCLEDLRDAVLAAIASPSYQPEFLPAAAIQVSPPTSPNVDQSIQRAAEVDHLQDQPPPVAFDANLELESPDLKRFMARPGLFGRLANRLWRLLRSAVRLSPTYQEPPGASRYTPGARLVLHTACVEACRMNHKYIGTEHILLGLLSEETAGRILENLGVSPVHVRFELFSIVSIVRFGTPMLLPKLLPWTPRSLRVLEFACREANSRQDAFIRPEYILLGAVVEEERAAGHVLRSNGLTSKLVWDHVERLLS